MRASVDAAGYPRPGLVRKGWTSLDGSWDFAYDDCDRGVSSGWFEPESDAFERTITVPFPPESRASGIGDPSFHPVVWYRRSIELPATTDDEVVLIHFGAVDQSADVWLDGKLLGHHEGGQTPFAFEVHGPARSGMLVVRAFDDPADTERPRGKQEWRLQPHAIWYDRTSGIWQPVWLEVVSRLRIDEVVWRVRTDEGCIEGELTLSRRPPAGASVEAVLSLGDTELTALRLSLSEVTTTFRFSVGAFVNAEENRELWWSPEHPTLFDVSLTLIEGEGVRDAVYSYLGYRNVSVGGGRFLLNGRPYYLRSVLEQGYWPESHLASPGVDALRREVELIKELGFNAARIHQKAEDPRFLYWADRLGLMLWGETAAAYTFSATAITALTTEWLALVRRDRSHPSIVAWVPMNESWGVPHLATRSDQVDFSRSLAALTRALDPTRPVISNDGWEHVDSDILGIHDYGLPGALIERYATSDRALESVKSARPGQRAITVVPEQIDRYASGSAPLMITEFGGISWRSDDGTWGYELVGSNEEYESALDALFTAIRGCLPVVGFCYTQLTDTMQEANGLLRADRTPKLPMETLRRIVTGEPSGSAG